MSGLEETIQLMEEGMKKVTDSLNVLNKTFYRDIVKEEQLDSKYLLKDEQEDEMKKLEIKKHYQGVYDKYEEKVKQLENEKKGLEQIFSKIEKAKGAMENMLSNKDSIKEAYDVNINNINITINEVIKMMNRNRTNNEAKINKISLSFNKHIDPRSKKEEAERKKKEEEQAAKAQAERIAKLEAECKAKEELEKKARELEQKARELEKRLATEKKAKEELEKKIKEKEKIAKLYNEYVINNIHKLEEWSGHQVNKVLYDSDIDGKDSSIFRNKIINHQHLYFIAIDSKNNVFGHYHSSIINRINSYISDSNIFIFTLNNNGRSGIKKFNNKDGNTFTWIYNSKNYYDCCDYNYSIRKIDTNNSFINSDIEKYYSGIKNTTLTGNPDHFTTKRIIVIQMK